MGKKQNIVYLENTVDRGELTSHTPIIIVDKERLNVCHSYLTESEVDKIIKRGKFNGLSLNGLSEVYIEPEPAPKGPSNAYCNCLVGIIAIAMAIIYFL